ncbi:hypothetical protein ACIRPP_18465 [Streptomyces sp. NPDC101219]|uniref:hypothetical protein n=1 Tax=Streptomyces sp. NPDC101219 TaxID=3366131 RepID=UPI00382BD5A6
MPRHAGGRARDPRTARLLALVGAATACVVALPLAAESGGSPSPLGAVGALGSAREAGRTGPTPLGGPPGAERAEQPGDTRGERFGTATGPAAAGDPAGRSGATDRNAEAPAGDQVGDGRTGVPEGAPGASDELPGPPPSTGLLPAPILRCGPELSSPDGIEAQTCVVLAGEEVWGRTYYRNATGTAPSAVLSLMAPGGRSVRVHCAVESGDEPAVCETPRRPRRGRLADHEAIVEFAARSGHGPLLLRAGSNPPGA